MIQPLPTDREDIAAADNPLGIDGVEFIEYTTARPQALGQVLEAMGFRPVARHRSREVLLYRQGGVNVIVNAHVNAHASGAPRGAPPSDRPVISALALRVRDAAFALRSVLDRGAWAVPTRVEVMELNIPAIHGVGTSRVYFVDRWREFSIYDVDFVPIPGAEARPAALAGFSFYGVVQYIGAFRMEDWTEFYAELFGFRVLPDEVRHGILPKGRVLQSPCGGFFLQLVEPEPGQLDIEGDESLHRLGLSTHDVPSAVAVLRRRGVDFVESASVRPDERGALTAPRLGASMFELVHHVAAAGEDGCRS